MPAMDRARHVAGLLWTAVGLAFQLLWLAFHDVRPAAVTLLLIGSVVLLAALSLVRAPLWAWLTGWVTSVLLGLDFAGAVADRFGAFGAPGRPGVSWGSWSAFVDYTAQLLPEFDRGLVTLAAVGATVVEVTLAALLISGWQRRWVGKAAAGLFVVYLLAMGFSLGADAVARYAMPILIGGALLVSSRSARKQTTVQPVTT
jgi:hypothetical protein